MVTNFLQRAVHLATCEPQGVNMQHMGSLLATVTAIALAAVVARGSGLSVSLAASAFCPILGAGQHGGWGGAQGGLCCP